MGKYHVYSHIDKETQTPFYIGMGQGNRAFDKSRNEFWKTYVREFAPDYEIRVIAENVDEETAKDIEHLLIQKFGKAHNGTGVLLNWTDGGHQEGMHIKVSLQDDLNGLTDFMTEQGRILYSSQPSHLNATKITSFLNTVLATQSEDMRNKLIVEIEKKSKPVKTFIVPFCLTEPITPSDTITLSFASAESIKQNINKPIHWSSLPSRKYVDSLIHRIMIHFDLILQDNVMLETNGKRISTPDPDWYFYKDYRTGYVKIIQASNSGLRLQARYIGPNKKDPNRSDIHDFEIIPSAGI